ncbi:MAG TPA: hypothetical protein VF606_02335, partial [Geminicoccaceae bacterium]
MALAFVALAAVLRSPALLYSVLNFDESLYLLIGADLTRGVLPYTGLCDRKPFGLFALFALFAAAPFDAIVASRLAASLAVGLTAYALHGIARILFADGERLIGRTAGLAYVVFTLATGGLTSNAELFHNALAVLGLRLALAAALRDPDRPPRGLFIAAGLALGLGVQVKQTVLFDMAAFLAGFFLLTTPRLADLGRQARAAAPSLAALAVASLLPTLAVILLYVATGHWGEWLTANVTAQRGFVDDRSQGFELGPTLRAMAEQAPLWVAAVVAALGAPRLLRGRGVEARPLLFLYVWIASIAAGQVILRIAADHYFLQFLPALCLLAGLAFGRGVVAAVPAGGARAAVSACVAALVLFAVAKNPYVNAAFMLKTRLVDGEAYAGDNARRLAEGLRPDLRPGDAVYVVGFMPVVYHLTGAVIPTRFAFTGLPHGTYAGRDGCPWVPQGEEIRRILDSRPRFVVFELGVFYDELDLQVKALLRDRIRRDYRLRAAYPQHPSHTDY